jgi:hypothetical protein
MASLPLPMNRRLAIVDDDGNGRTGNDDDNKVHDNGAMGDNNNNDQDGATEDKVNNDEGNGTMDDNIKDNCDGVMMTMTTTMTTQHTTTLDNGDSGTDDTVGNDDGNHC